MFTIEGFLTFHDWTHQTYKPMLAHVAKIPKSKLTKKLEGFGFPTLKDQLFHIGQAEAYWVTAAQGKKFTPWDKKELNTVEAIAKKLRSTKAATRRYLRSLNNKKLEKPITIVFPSGRSISITPAKMVTKFLTHSFHHKGQVVAMCRLLGYPPPSTDLA